MKKPMIVDDLPVIHKSREIYLLIGVTSSAAIVVTAIAFLVRAFS